ncbi:mammalian cell entry protein, partial [Acinetobacter baumannii]
DENGKDVVLKVFVNAPYDRYVTSNARFWHASGIDLKLDAGGFQVNTQSLAAIAAGGIAFQAPEDAAADEVAAAETEFVLAPDQTLAMKRPD